jgi:hypothetical protein
MFKYIYVLYQLKTSLPILPIYHCMNSIQYFLSSYSQSTCFFMVNNCFMTLLMLAFLLHASLSLYHYSIIQGYIPIDPSHHLAQRTALTSGSLTAWLFFELNLLFTCVSSGMECFGKAKVSRSDPPVFVFVQVRFACWRQKYIIQLYSSVTQQ